MTAVQSEDCDHPATEQCSWCRPDKTFKKPAVRIDTIRNTLAVTHELLSMVERELEDLHVLAYERQTIVSEERVSPGHRSDYALDTHGDIRARNAYRQLGDTTMDAAERLQIAARATVKLLREGEPTGHRPRRLITAVELAQAIAAQTRRLARGEYTPVRRERQPKPGA